MPTSRRRQPITSADKRKAKLLSMILTAAILSGGSNSKSPKLNSKRKCARSKRKK